MKSFLKTTIIIAIIITLICLVQKLGMLDFFTFDISEEQLSNYSEYYFNQLELDEKKMYVRIDEAIKQRREKVFLCTHGEESVTTKINRTLIAYFYDNPECYYISNEYVISTKNLRLFTYSTLQLDYITTTDYEIDTKNKQLETAIDNMLKDCITDTMSDFEKEVAIHDALVAHTSYYEYEDINAIPAIKHTAYGALVEKEAVCDGYSKAFKMLLEEAGIESVIISGITENVAHAWNIVKLEDSYYHVDATSDKIDEKGNKYVVHTYFNVNDETISKTHTINNVVEYPKCDASKYEYYTQRGYYVDYKDNLYNKLQEIILKQKNSALLEVRIDDKYTSTRIIDTLYDLNFNSWRSSGKTSVSYNKDKDIYFFVK